MGGMRLRTFIKAICVGAASLWPFSKFFQGKALGYAKEGITRAELTVVKVRGMTGGEVIKGRQAALELQRILKWQARGAGAGNPIKEPAEGETGRVRPYMRGVFKRIDEIAQVPPKEEHGPTEKPK